MSGALVVLLVSEHQEWLGPLLYLQSVALGVVVHVSSLRPVFLLEGARGRKGEVEAFHPVVHLVVGGNDRNVVEGVVDGLVALVLVLEVGVDLVGSFCPDHLATRLHAEQNLLVVQLDLGTKARPDLKSEIGEVPAFARIEVAPAELL